MSPSRTNFSLARAAASFSSSLAMPDTLQPALPSINGGASVPLVLGAPGSAPSLDGRDGLQPRRQSQNAGDAKERGQELWHIFCCQSGKRLRSSQDHPCRLDRYAGLRDEGRFRSLAGFCDHGAVDRETVRQPVNQTVPDQYGLSTALLSGDGSDPGRMAVVKTIPRQ